MINQVMSKFFTAYRTTPNPIVPDGKLYAEVMCGRRIRTIFNTLLPPGAVERWRQNENIRSFVESDKVVVKSYLGKNQWGPGFIEERM